MTDHRIRAVEAGVMPEPALPGEQPRARLEERLALYRTLAPAPP